MHGLVTMNLGRFLAESCCYQGINRLRCTITPMMKPILCAALMCITGQAWAQNPAPPNRAPATRPQVQVTAADCRRLVQHVPSADVNFRPGVDVYGRSVAPADLNPAPPLGPPERMTVYIDADLRRFGVPSTSPLFQPFVGVGEISFDRNGNVFFNGQPLGGSEQAAIAEICRSRMPGAR